MNRNIAILTWALKRHHKLPIKLFELAAQSGNLEVLLLLQKHNIVPEDIDFILYHKTVQEDSNPVKKWLVSGCKYWY